MAYVVLVTPEACDPKSISGLRTLIELASDSTKWVEHDARYLLDKIDQILTDDVWREVLDGEPKSWERFCSQELGYDAEFIETLRAGVGILEARGVPRPTVKQAMNAAQEIIGKVAPIGVNGTNQYSNTQELGSYNIRPSTQDSGTRADYLAARIKRDFPEIATRMAAGEYRSVRQAALEAGIVKPVVQVPQEPERAARALLRHFNADELREIVNLLLYAIGGE